MELMIENNIKTKQATDYPENKNSENQRNHSKLVWSILKRPE